VSGIRGVGRMVGLLGVVFSLVGIVGGVFSLVLGWGGFFPCGIGFSPSGVVFFPLRGCFAPCGVGFPFAGLVVWFRFGFLWGCEANFWEVCPRDLRFYKSPEQGLNLSES